MFKFAGLCIAMCSFAARAQGEAGKGPVNGLSLTLVVDHTAPTSALPKVRVDLQNTEAADQLVKLGFALGNGQDYPTALVLSIVDERNVTRELSLIGPPGVAGNLTVLTVPIPKGASFSIPIDLNKYGDAKTFDFTWPPGRYRLRAVLTGTAAAAGRNPYWVGRATSNALVVDIAR